MKRVFFSFLFVIFLSPSLNSQETQTVQETVKNSNLKDKDLGFDVAGLMQAAKLAREKAYAPYSKFKVGAAILTEDGKIFTGVNVENSSYGLTVCAERVAIFKAVSEGYTKFKAIAIMLDAPDFGSPCGACRQVIYEFGKDIIVIMGTINGNYEIKTISELLPYGFSLNEN